MKFVRKENMEFQLKTDKKCEKAIHATDNKKERILVTWYN